MSIKSWFLAFGELWRHLIWQTIYAFAIVVFVLAMTWNYLLAKPVYQHHFGVPHSDELRVAYNPIYNEIEEPIKPIVIKKYGKEVKIDFLRYYQITGRVVGVDQYNAIGTYFRVEKNATVFDMVAPFDVAIAWGQLADEKAYKKDSYLKDYRKISASIFSGGGKTYQNIHVMPANKNVLYGLKALSKNRLAQMRGYAVKVQEMGKDKDFVITSTIPVENEKPNAAKKADVVFLYLNEITYDGYTFK